MPAPEDASGARPQKSGARRSRGGPLLFALLLMAAAPIAPGVWGGPQVQMEVGAAATHIRFDCAEGAIPGALTLDADGRFEARGRYDAFTGGAQAVDERPSAAKANAHFIGRVEGDRLTLEIRRDGVEAPLRYTLVKGVRAKLIRCL